MTCAREDPQSEQCPRAPASRAGEPCARQVHPGIEVECLTRASAGDRDLTSPLWQMGDRGAFTADLSQALLRGEADVVVHSFKDMPIELPAGTRIAGALPRADPRDVLLVRRRVVAEKPEALIVLSSSPRRAWLLQETLPSLLPWLVRSVATEPVRGNIETRLRKLVEGDAHGLVVAKAALDRLLTFGPPFDREAGVVRGYLDQCYPMVLPMREFPWAPAQGAIALEIAEPREDLQAWLSPIVCRSTTSYGGGRTPRARRVRRRLSPGAWRRDARYAVRPGGERSCARPIGGAARALGTPHGEATDAADLAGSRVAGSWRGGACDAALPGG